MLFLNNLFNFISYNLSIKNIIYYSINPEAWQGVVFLYNPEKEYKDDFEITDMKEAKEIIERIMKK